MNRRTVVVAGGGLAGLTAAALAARAGHTVTLVERAVAPGGRARAAGKNGFHMNMGAHALYRQGEAARVLRVLGIEPDGVVPEGGQFADWQGRRELLPGGPLALATTGLLSTAEKLELGMLLARLSWSDPAPLETLTPKQRAVLILRDVLDYSVADAARVLALSEANVKTTLHRARRVLERARENEPIDRKLADLPERAGAALVAFIQALGNGDGPALERLLAEDVLSLSDGGGEFLAAVQPIRGRDHVMRFWLGVAKKNRGTATVQMRSTNYEPTLYLRFDSLLPRQAPRSAWRVELDREGRIVRIFAILATRKLSAVSV